jgi:hypothetical protein
MLADLAGIGLALGLLGLLLIAVVGLVGTIDLWSRRRARAQAWLASSVACVAAVTLLRTLGPAISIY